MYLINYRSDLKSVSGYNFGINEEHFKLKNKKSIFIIIIIIILCYKCVIGKNHKFLEFL